jgi:hypothetical protein
MWVQAQDGLLINSSRIAVISIVHCKETSGNPEHWQIIATIDSQGSFVIAVRLSERAAESVVNEIFKATASKAAIGISLLDSQEEARKIRHESEAIRDARTTRVSG